MAKSATLPAGTCKDLPLLPACLAGWLPTCLPACLPACLAACLHACLPPGIKDLSVTDCCSSLRQSSDLAVLVPASQPANSGVAREAARASNWPAAYERAVFEH